MVWIMLVMAQPRKYHCETLGIELMSRDYKDETCRGITIPSLLCTYEMQNMNNQA